MATEHVRTSNQPIRYEFEYWMRASKGCDPMMLERQGWGYLDERANEMWNDWQDCWNVALYHAKNALAGLATT